MKNKKMILPVLLAMSVTLSGISLPVQAKNAAGNASQTVTATSKTENENGVITFNDGFEGYNTEYTEAGTMLPFESGNAKLLGVNSAGSWKTSGVWKGSTNSGVYLTSDSMYVSSDQDRNAAAVNLDLGMNKLGKVYHVNGYTQTGARSVRFMVSADEKSFYEMGIIWPDWTRICQNGTAISNEVTLEKANSPRPFFRKVVNGQEESLTLANVSNITNTNDENSYTITNISGEKTANILFCPDYAPGSNPGNWTEFDASIDYAANKITVSFISEKLGGVSFDYTDAALADISDNARYPVSLVGYNKPFGRFKGVSVSYDLTDSWDYSETFLDTSSSEYEGTAIGKDSNGNNCPVKTVDGTDVPAGAAFTSGTDTTIYTNNGASYIFGGVYGRNATNTNGTQTSYAGFLKNSALMIADRYNNNSTVNVKVQNYDASKLSDVYVHKNSSTISYGIKLLSDEKQKTFYVIGIRPDTYNSMTNASDGTNYKATPYTPFIAKYSNGKCVQYVSSETALTDKSDFSKAVDINAEIGYRDINASMTFASGQKIDMTFTDESLVSMRRNAVYPVSMESCGDGYALYDAVAMNFDGYEVKPEEGYSFTDYFDSYDKGLGVGEAADAVSSVPGTAQTLAKGSGYEWQLSGTRYGYHTGNKKYSSAYIGYTSGELAVSDQFQTGTTVNLKPDNADFAWVSKVEFNSRIGDSRRGARALVNGYEDTYWEFCMARAYDSKLSNQYTGNQPYVRKVVNGQTVYENVFADAQDTETPTAFAAEKWVVTFGDDGTVAWTVTDTSDSTKTWSGTYKDADLDSMMNDIAYPAAMYAYGDGYSYFDNVKLVYTENLPLLTENENGGYTATIQPIIYRRFMQNKDYLTVIAAYYSEENEIVKTDAHIVSDLENSTSFDVAAPSEVNAARGKIFIWDGSALNVRKLHSESFN